MKNVLYSIGFISLYLLGSCHSSDQWDQKAAQLTTKKDSLDLRYSMINHAIDSLWDSTTAEIARTMPAEVPPVDREIFLTSRNANHIKMFDSFQLLPATTRELVDQAAMKDQILADQLADLAVRKQIIEKERMAFLSEVAGQEPALLNHYAEPFRHKANQAE